MDLETEPALELPSNGEDSTESSLETGASNYWRKLIRDNLRTDQKECIHNGRLDPHNMFSEREGTDPSA